LEFIFKRRRNKMTEFDPFSEEQTALPASVFFGEIVILRGYKGIKIQGERGFPEYDSQDSQHQRAVADGKKTYIVYEVQHYPIGVDFDTWPNQWPIWSDDWKLFEASLGELYGLDPNNAAERKTLYGEHVRALSNGGQFFMYETPAIRTYTNAEGQEKSVRGIKVLQKFANMDECQAAYDEHKGNAPLPADSKMGAPKVEALPLQQAIGFAETLTRQAIGSDNKVDLDKLTASFQAMPMLAELKVDLPEVQEVIKKVEKESLPF